MTTPPKAKKTPRNQPIRFDETLAATLSAPVTLSQSRPQIWSAARRFQVGLWAVWMAAAVLGGIGLGRLILATRTASIAEPPAPVATVTVRVASLGSAFAIIVPQPANTHSSLQLTPAFAINQAQAGIPMSTISEGALQSTAPVDALQPGFNHFGAPQGSVGTTPVY